MNETRFAQLWPTAEARGWTLEQVGYGHYATPPPTPENIAQQRVNNWHNYISYQGKLVFVHHLFEQEMEQISPPAAHTSQEAQEAQEAQHRDESDNVFTAPSRQMSCSVDVSSAPPTTTQLLMQQQAQQQQRKRKGWGRWIKSFIWR